MYRYFLFILVICSSCLNDRPGETTLPNNNNAQKIIKQKSAIYDKISKIRKLPKWYTSEFEAKPKEKYDISEMDSAFINLVESDTTIIPELMKVLYDSAYTDVPNSCLGGKFTYNQLAFLLINEIEAVPYAAATNSQWCTIGECGWLPDGFLGYVRTGKFAVDYEIYFRSSKRKEWLRIGNRKPKWLTKHS